MLLDSGTNWCYPRKHFKIGVQGNPESFNRRKSIFENVTCQTLMCMQITWDLFRMQIPRQGAGWEGTAFCIPNQFSWARDAAGVWASLPVMRVFQTAVSDRCCLACRQVLGWTNFRVPSDTTLFLWLSSFLVASQLRPLHAPSCLRSELNDPSHQWSRLLWFCGNLLA